MSSQFNSLKVLKILVLKHGAEKNTTPLGYLSSPLISEWRCKQSALSPSDDTGYGQATQLKCHSELLKSIMYSYRTSNHNHAWHFWNGYCFCHEQEQRLWIYFLKPPRFCHHKLMVQDGTKRKNRYARPKSNLVFFISKALRKILLLLTHICTRTPRLIVYTSTHAANVPLKPARSCPRLLRSALNERDKT